jgi:uncharacterized protein (DUF1800 family)
MKRTLTLLACVLLLAAKPTTAQLTERQRAQHVLDRLAFGARPGDLDRVLATGVDKWIAQQLHPESIPDRAVEARLAQYPTLTMSDSEIWTKFYQPVLEARREKKADPHAMIERIPKEQRPQRVVAELSAQRILRAAGSERQLNEVMVDFWFNHFNVYAPKGLDKVLLTSYERDVIRPHIWDKFEDLLMATAKSPAMLFYLDNARSAADPANRPPLPPRVAMRMQMRNNGKPQQKGGLNENYARELMELHTLGVDGGYTQKDVTELARVFTGWTIGRPNEGGGFVFRRAMHDIGPKTVLGVHFPAGGGEEEGERMIHILAHHPATAHHIADQLCQRFIADEPPASAVDRVAKVFLASDGDLRKTVQAVIDSPEFWDPKDYRAKVKTPFEYTVSAVRAVDGQIDDPLPLARQLQQMGEGLYLSQPPTGYSDKAEAWVSTGGLMARLNFALALAANKVPGVHVDVTKLAVPDDLSAETRKTIAAKHADPVTTAGLILGSPEFQRQ